MKKITFLACLLMSGLALAQEQENIPEAPQDIHKKQEVKINTFSLLALKWIDISYERIINKESSFGVSATFNTDAHDDDSFKSSLTPYYRRYFSNELAKGFFIEAFGMFYSEEDGHPYDYYHKYSQSENFAMGISVGGKFVSKDGFTTELLLGAGRNFWGNGSEGVFRIGVSIGYRF